ncbi:MAG: GNAT family N-acetyltransferase [Candidatus Bathyarchaeia archaeon]
MERVKRLTSSPNFHSEGFFIAEKDGLPIGCIGVFNLPAEGFLEIRYLAVKDAFSNLVAVDELIEAALSYSLSQQPKMLKAATLAIQPYVGEYKRFGFKPIRRILRIAWDLTKIPEEQLIGKTSIIEVTEENLEEACRVFVDGVQPHWDWWIEEEGGREMVSQKAAEWIRHSVAFAAKVDNKIVGVTGIAPHHEGGEASFLGVMVLPQYRMKGIGWTLMKAAINKTKQLGHSRLVVHTMAYLESLAPGAILYLKSGGKIEAEYLHLIKDS